MKCIQLACEQPAEPGEFRVVNQLTEWFSVGELAEIIDLAIQYKDNIREELIMMSPTWK